MFCSDTANGDADTALTDALTDAMLDDDDLDPRDSDDLADLQADILLFDAAVAALEAAETALSDFELAVVDFVTTGGALAAAKEALADLVEAADDSADAATAALEAIENPTDGDPAGLGINVLEGAENFVAGDDVYLFSEAAGPQALIDFGADGEDQIFFGEDFVLTMIPDGDDINDSVGDVSQLEILWMQNGADLDLYVESEVFAGNGSTDADTTLITLTGVDAGDVSFADGFLSIA